MKYYEGADYWVRYLDFPNMASESVVASNGDGTFTIFINTLFCPKKQRERLAHEIKHLTEEHFYRDDLEITQIEHAADGIVDTPKKYEPLPDVLFFPPPGEIACFHSLASMKKYLVKIIKQKNK